MPIPSREEIRRRLAEPLPGIAAHATLVPAWRDAAPSPPPPTARRSAVLVVLAEDGAGVHLPSTNAAPASRWMMPLIVRVDDGGPHGGQIGLPGGRHEYGESFPVATALRESEEEVGLPTGSCEIVGALTPFYIAVSNFLVAPVVAFSALPWRILAGRLRPQPDEVAAIVGADPMTFNATRAQRSVYARGMRYRVPSYAPALEPVVPATAAVADAAPPIWGATAIMVAELLAVLDEAAR